MKYAENISFRSLHTKCVSYGHYDIIITANTFMQTFVPAALAVGLWGTNSGSHGVSQAVPNAFCHFLSLFATYLVWELRYKQKES